MNYLLEQTGNQERSVMFIYIHKKISRAFYIHLRGGIAMQLILFIVMSESVKLFEIPEHEI